MSNIKDCEYKALTNDECPETVKTSGLSGKTYPHNDASPEKHPISTLKSDIQDDDEYCRALAWAIYKGKCPMTVGLYVPWGRCKDALLEKIREHLNEISKKSKNSNDGNRKLTIKEFVILVCRMLFYIPMITKEHEDQQNQHIIFIKFNAWHCMGCDRMWAGLVTALCDGIEDEFGRIPISLYRALYKSNEMTEESESKEWAPKKVLYMSDLFWTLFVILFLITALLLKLLLFNFHTHLKDYMFYTAVTTFGGFLLLQSGMILKVMKNYITTQKGELMNKMKRTDMSSQLGFMADVKKEIEIITSYLQVMEVHQKKKIRVIIEITKLDKCMPDRVVEVIYAINILLSNPDAPFICILAVDPGIIVECVEKSDLLKGMVNNGYLFLNQVVTLAFSIPKMNDNSKSQYLKQIIYSKSTQIRKAKETKDSPISESCHPLEVKIDIDEEQETTELINKALDSLASTECLDYITDNVINMRRIVNTIIITVRLMIKDGTYKNSADKVTKWVIMAAQWPCSLSWILQCIEDEQQSRQDQNSHYIVKELWKIYEMSLDALHANRQSLTQLLELDGDPDIFCNLLKNTKFTVEDANMLRKYTVNLDHTIQRKIELLQGSFNFLRFKEEKSLNRMALLEMGTDDVCRKMKDLNLYCVDYIKKIEEHNLNGKALLYSDNMEIRKALGMNMGDWVKFRAAFLSLPTPNLYF